jgi:sulfate permease
MFNPMYSVLLIPFLVAMFLAINMGGSGTAPSFSAAYGANIIRKDLIPGLFGLFVFFGALVAGKKVSLTISKGILPAEIMGITMTTIILLSVSVSLLMANLLKIPQSTSQATVFALTGPAIYFNMLKTQKLFFEIIPTWFILPCIAFLITLFVGKFIYPHIRQREILRFEALSQHPGWKVFVILASCYVAFAVGSNNVANAGGPIVSMVSNELKIDGGGDNFLLVMILATLIVAPCFAIGGSVFGKHVLQTTGREIIKFGPLGASLISITTASLLLWASVARGIPTSLVQMNTAAIIGIGVSKQGWQKTLKLASVKRLITIWIIAPLISLGLSFSFTIIASKLGLV